MDTSTDDLALARARTALERVAADLATAVELPDDGPFSAGLNPRPELALLRATHHLAGLATEQMGLAAYRAGAAGASYTALGAAVGVSRQAAVKRWPDAATERTPHTPATGTSAYTPRSRAWELTDRVRTPGHRPAAVDALLAAYATAEQERAGLTPSGEEVAEAWQAGGEAAVDDIYTVLDTAALALLRDTARRTRRMAAALDDYDTGPSWQVAAAHAWRRATREATALSVHDHGPPMVPRGLGIAAGVHVLERILDEEPPDA